MSLVVRWDGEIGRLERIDERTREYAFRYTTPSARPISLSLPLRDEPYAPTESRAFFEALLPEGAVREQVARQLRLAPGDTYGLLEQLGRDCAGALQIEASEQPAMTPAVRWLDEDELDELVEQLPRRPLGMRTDDGRVRLSLAGVQRKAVLVRDADGRFGQPLDGMPSTHILKPDPRDDDLPDLAVNECFCMRLALRCGLPVAPVELIEAAGRRCLAVERFDRDHSTWPPTRLHQEDLCQALGLTPDFKYQRADWQLPSYRALADLLDGHAIQPGLDRLAAARSVVFHFLVGNADAHAKNVALLHLPDGVRFAPLYDVVATAAYDDGADELAMAIGDELDPSAIGVAHWSDLANDFGLQPRAFERVRAELVERTLAESRALRDEARDEGWHDPVLDTIVDVVTARSAQVVA
ncbi:MAG TPA: type II toxin-antitoxin system HipA family toxin [Conexibacter sp.]|nr:type II toxin-antitoxin system HipA family toxin [Conexibacter sp.]